MDLSVVSKQTSHTPNRTIIHFFARISAVNTLSLTSVDRTGSSKGPPLIAEAVGGSLEG